MYTHTTCTRTTHVHVHQCTHLLHASGTTIAPPRSHGDKNGCLLLYSFLNSCNTTRPEWQQSCARSRPASTRTKMSTLMGTRGDVLSSAPLVTNLGVPPVLLASVSGVFKLPDIHRDMAGVSPSLVHRWCGKCGWVCSQYPSAVPAANVDAASNTLTDVEGMLCLELQKNNGTCYNAEATRITARPKTAYLLARHNT